MLFIDAKYNRSCLGFFDRLFTLMVSVGILILKVLGFIANDFQSNNGIASDIFNTISELSSKHYLLPLLVVPVLALLVGLINILSTISSKIHELISGIATVFFANLLVRIVLQNPFILDNSAAFNKQYAVAVVGAFILVLISFYAVCYPTLKAIVITSKSKRQGNLLQETGNDFAKNANPSSSDRQHYLNTGKTIVGGFSNFFINLTIFIMSILTTFIWLFVSKNMIDHLSTATLVIMLVIPSLINMFEVLYRPDAKENLLKEFIQNGEQILPKKNRFGLALAQIKKIILPFI